MFDSPLSVSLDFSIRNSHRVSNTLASFDRDSIPMTFTIPTSNHYRIAYDSIFSSDGALFAFSYGSLGPSTGTLIATESGRVAFGIRNTT